MRPITRIVMTCALLLAGQARAVTRTWTGGGPDDNWSSAGNWSPSGAPSSGDALVFVGSTRLTPNNDLTPGTSFLSITFNSGAGNFNLGGNAVALSGGTGAIASNVSSGQMTMSMDVTITANTTVTVFGGGTVLLLGTFDNAGLPVTADGSGTAHFGGPITGSGSLTLAASGGVLKLSGSNSGLTGAITVSAGTLVLDNPNGLGTTAQGTTVAAGAVLDLNGTACATAEPLTLYGTGISSTGALVNSASGAAVFPGPITLGSAALISADNGSLTLSGTAPIAGNYPLTLSGSGSGSLAAGLGSGIGGLTKSGAGTWSLLGTGSASSGSTTVSGGTLDLGNPGSLGNGGITLNGGNLSFHDNGSGSNALIDYGRSLDLATGATATIHVANAGTNTGNTIKIGSFNCGNATLNVTGANGYRFETGPLALNGSPSGTVYLNPSTASLVIGSVTGGAYPYTLDLGGTSTGSRINGAIADGSASLSIAKSGTSAWMLAGAGTYTGATSINGGALVLGADNALGSTAAGTTVASGAMLDLAGTNYSAAEALTVNGTGNSGSGALANSNSATAVFAGPITLGSASSIVGETGAIDLVQVGSLGGPYTLTLGGSQGGSFSANPSSGSLAKTGTGTWTRSGSSGLALSSLSLSQGTLALGSGMTHTLSTSLTVTGGVLDFGSSTLQISASSVDLSALTGLTAGTGTLELYSTSAQAFIPSAVGNPKLKKSGAGTLTVNGQLDAGALSVNSGTWDWGSGTLTHYVDGITTSGSSGMSFGSNTVTVRENACDLSGLAVLNSGSGQLVLSSAGAQDFTPLSGSGHPKVVKQGSGTTSLITADLTAYGLQVQAGTLDLGNRAVTVNGNLEVGGGTLEAIAAGLTVTGDFTLSGGNFSMPSGTLYVAGNVSRTGGTAAHNNGWLTLNGPSPGKTFDFSPTLYNLNVNAAGGGWIAANHGFTVANLFQVQYGAFSLGTALNHTAASFNSIGGTLDFGSSTLAISGSTAYFAGLASITTGTGTLEFTGATAQTFHPITGYAFPAVKRSGTGTTTLTTNPLLANSLILSGGTLNLGSGLITTTSGLSITGGSLDFGSGTLKFSGATADFTSLAALTPGAGTLEFTGSSAQTFIPKASLTFPGLTQSGTGGTAVATNAFHSNGPLFLAYGTFDLGVSLSHSAASIGASAGSLVFNNSTLSVTSGDANLSTLSALSPGTGSLAFTAASGTQILTPMNGNGHPSIQHTGAGALALANYDLSCLSFSQTAGSLDFGGHNITTTAGGNFSIANGNASTLANLAGRTLTIAGNASFAGSSTANRLDLNPASAWTLAVSGSLTASLATLKNSLATVSAGACGDCSDAGGNSNWNYSVHWIGSGTPNWSLAANWGSGSIPAGGDDVIFDAGSQNAVLDAAVTVKSLTMAGGYTGSFDFGSYTLSVMGTADFRTGGSIIPGTGALSFAGAAAQTFYPKSGATFPDLIVSGGGTATVSGSSLSAGNLNVTSGGFNLGSGTRSVTGVSGTGSLDFATSDLNAAGNVDLSAMTVTAGGRTLYFQGASPQTYKPNAALTGLSLGQAGTGGTTVVVYGFTAPALSLSGGALYLGTGLTHTVATTLSLGGGTLDFGSSTLRVAAAAADFSGLAALTPGTGALHFTGATAQTFKPKSGANFPSLVQNGSGGATVTVNPLQAASLTVQAGTFGFGSALSHTLNGIAATGGGLDFGSATVVLPAGDADFSGLSSLTASGGKLAFTGATGTQNFTPKAGTAHPVIEHNGAGVLRLAGNALLCAAFRNLAGGFDLNGLDLSASGALEIFGGAGSLANLGGRTLTAGGNATLRGQPGDHLGLAPGAPWTLAVSGLLKAANADLGRNTASLSPGAADSSVDLGGNVNWTFLDTIPPFPVTAFQANRAGGHAVRLAFTPSASPDGDSVMIRYRADGVYPASRTDGLLWRTVPKADTLDTAMGLPDKAVLAFAAFARDSSGNYAAPAASARDTAFMPDVTAPSNVKAFSATAIAPAYAALAWTAPDSADADSVMIRYRADGTYPAGIADGTLLRVVSNARTRDTAVGLSANVVYHFGLFARDSSGNWSPAAAGAQDSSLYQAPVLGSLAISDSQGFTRDVDPALLFSSTGADSMRFCLLSDTALAPWLAIRSRDSINLGTGADGQRIVAAQFKNAFGRRSSWYLDTTAIDRTSPAVALDLKPAHSWRDWPNAVAGRARDALAGTDSVFVLRKRLADGYAYNGSGWTTVPDTARFRADSVFSAPLPGGAIATGRYEFTVWAKDKLGNLSGQTVMDVDYTENRAPEAASATVADTVYQNQPVTWSVAIGDRDAGDSVLAVSVSAPAWLNRTETADTGQGGFAARRIFSFAGTALQADVAASANLVLQVRDLGGKTFLYSKSFTVLDVNDPPSFASGRDSVTAEERAETRYIPHYRDPDPADKGTLALLSAPAWATLEDSALVLRPGSRDVGRTLVRITVSDGRLLDTLDLTVDALNANDSPVAFPGARWPGAAGWKEDVPDSFTVVVVDMDKNDQVDLKSPLPAFLSYRASVDSTGFNHFFRFACAPGQKDTGSYPLRLRFADAAGAASELALNAKVASVNDTPFAVVAALQTAAGAAKVGLDVKDEDGSLAATRFHYRLIDAKGDTVRAGICAGSSLALQPLADGDYTLALAAEDEGGLRQSAYTRTALSITGATSLAVDSARWDMIAYPGRALAASALGAGANLATWDEATGDGSPGRYASGKAADSLFRGKGYWVKAMRRIVLSAALAELSDKPYPLKLVRGKQGWNQIGNPYPYYVDLSASGFTFWEWDPAKRDLADAKGILKPWGAYWVQAKRDTVITIPNRPWFPPAAAPLARVAATGFNGPAQGRSGGYDPESWSLQLALSAGPYRDEANFLGIRRASPGASVTGAAATGPGSAASAAGIAPDGTLGEAPKFGEYIALRFERPGQENGDGLAGGFAADFRPGLSSDEEWWDFAVENRATGLGRATLALPGLADLAARGLYAFLVERGEAKALQIGSGLQALPRLQAGPGLQDGSGLPSETAMAADAAIELDLGDSVAHFSLVITPHPDFAARLKGNFNISQNFPNPARELTTFRFFLPQAWDAHGKRVGKDYRLKLNVYDYRGRLAATVAEGAFAPGPHTLSWRPQAKGGGSLAPGAYVYRLETAGFAKSLKLIVK